MRMRSQNITQWPHILLSPTSKCPANLSRSSHWQNKRKHVRSQDFTNFPLFHPMPCTLPSRPLDTTPVVAHPLKRCRWVNMIRIVILSNCRNEPQTQMTTGSPNPVLSHSSGRIAHPSSPSPSSSTSSRSRLSLSKFQKLFIPSLVPRLLFLF